MNAQSQPSSTSRANPRALRRALPGGLGRRLLMWFILLAAAPLIAGGTVLFLQGWRSAAADSLEGMQERAAAVQAHITSWFVPRRDAFIGLNADAHLPPSLKSLTTLPPSDSAHELARQQVATIFATFVSSGLWGGDFAEVFLTDANGAVVYSYAPPGQKPDSGYDFAQRLPGWQTATWGKIYISPPQRLGDHPYFLLLAPVQQAFEDKPTGWLGAWLHADYLEQEEKTAQQSMGSAAGASLYLMTRQTRVEGLQQYLQPLSGAENTQAYTTGGGIDALLALDPAAEASCGALQPDAYSNYKQQSVLGAYCQVRDLHLTVVAEQTQQGAYALLYRNFIYGAAIFVIVLILASLLAWLVARSITAPLAALSDTASRVAAGDLAQRVQIASRDEIGMLGQAFNTMTERLSDMYGSLETTVARRTQQMRLAAEVSRVVTELTDTSTLLPQIVELVRERYDFYYTGLFLLDETGGWAVLEAGTGEPGREMRERGHRLEVGGKSMVGWVAARNEPRIALDVGIEAVRFNNPLLPETRSEAALPLRAGGRLLGVIDVQSRRPSAFSEDDLIALQSLADQVGVAIDNARLYSDQTRRAEQRLRVMDIARNASAERDVDVMLQNACDMVRNAFDYYSVSITLLEGVDAVTRASAVRGGRRHVGVGATVTPGVGIIGSSLGSGETLLVPDVTQDGRYLFDGALPGTRSELAVPLKLGERVIGVIDIESEQVNGLGAGDMDLMQMLAGLLAVAVDNARLFQQTNASLRDVSAMYRRYTQEAWQPAAGTGTLAYEHTLPDVPRLGALPREDLARAEGAGGVVALRGDGHSAAGRSALIAPINLRGVSIGGVAVYDTERERDWSEDDQLLLQAASSEVALALENARLFRQTQELLQTEQQRRKLADTLREVAEAVSSTLKLDELLNLILDELQRVVAFDTASVQLLEGDELVIIGGRGFEQPDKVIGLRFPLHGDNPNFAVYTQRTPVVVPDTHARYEHMRHAPHDHIRSWLGVPLVYGERMLGMLTLDSRQLNAFSDEQAQLAMAFANQAAAAIQNAELFAETERHAQQFATLNDISREVSSATRLDDVLEIIYERTRQVVESDGFFIALYDDQTQEFNYELIYDHGERYPRLTRQLLPGSDTLRAVEQKRTIMVLFNAEEVEEQRLRAGTIGSGQMSASLLYAPLMLGERAIGVISAQSYKFNVYTSAQRELISAIANQTASAIQNVRLFQEAQQRAEELVVLNEVGRAVNSVLSLDELYPVLHQQVGRLMDADSFYVALYEADKDETYLPYVVDLGERQESVRRRRTGLTGYIIDHPEPLLLSTPAEREALTAVPMVGTPSECYLGVPLIYSDQVIGMMAVQNYEHANVYRENEVRLLMSIAQQASAAIQNARLFAQAERRAEELAALNEVSRAVTSVLSLEDLYQVLHQQVGRLMEAGSFYIALYDEDAQMVSIPFMIEQGRREPRDPRPVTRGLTGYVIRNRRAINLKDNVEIEQARMGVEVVGNAAKCWLGVPMFLGERVLGVLAVQSYERERLFDDNHERILQAIANQTATALQNTRLFEETQQARRQAEERLRESVALQSISRAVSRTLELNEVLDIILEQIIYTLGFESSMISLVDEREGMVKAVRGVGVSEAQIAGAQRALDETDIMADVVRTGKTEVIDQYDARFDREMFEREGHANLVRVWTPIVSRGRNIGIVEAGFHKAHRASINESDVRLLQAFVDQAAIGIENSRLFAETQRRAVQLSTASEVSRAATSILDPDELVRETVSLIRERFNYYYVALFLLDEDGRYAVLKEATGEAGRVLKERGHRLEAGGQSMVGWAVSNKRARIALDVGADAVRFANPLLPESRSEIALPLRVGERVVGVLDAQSTQAGAFSNEDIDVLQSMADQLATTIDNARLFQESKRRAQEVTALFEAGQEINVTLDLDSLFEVVARRLRDVTRVAAVTVSDWDRDTNRIITRAHASEPDKIVDVVGSSYVLDSYPSKRRLLAEGLPLIVRVSDAQADTREVQLLRRSRMGSSLLLPLTVRDNVVGLIELFDEDPARSFGGDQVRLASTLVNQAAVAIQNSRLFAETQAALDETAVLYQAGRAISAATGADAVLAAIMDNVAPPDIDRVSLLLFGAERRADGIPLTFETLAVWGPRAGEAPAGRQPLDQLPFIALSNPYAPVMFDDLRADPRLDPRSRAVIAGMQLRSLGAIPLTLASTNQWIGLLLIHTLEPHAHRFGEREVRLYHTLAGQAAVQLDRLSGEAALARRANQLLASAEVSRAAASVLDQDSLLRQTADLIRERFGFYHVQVFLLEEPGPTTNLRASTGDVGRRLLSGEQTFNTGAGTLYGWVLGNRTPRVATLNGDAFFQPHALLPGTRSQMVAPMMVGERVLGLLDVHSEELQAFGADDIAILSSLSDQIAVAISNAQLFTESRRRLNELALLFKVTTATAGAARVDDVMQRASDALHEGMAQAQVSIFLREEDALRARAMAGYAAADPDLFHAIVGEGVIGWVALTGQPAVIGDVRQDTRYRQIDPLTRSELAVPLIAGQQVIGVLNVERPQPSAFTQDDLRLLTTLSSSLATVVQNARLFEEVQAANVRLREVDRLKSEFLASMSHELRTPLNSIIGFSRVILKGIDGPLTDLQQTDLNAIHASGQHLLGLINDILDLSKIEAGKLELAFDEVNLQDVLKSVMSTAVGLTKDKQVELRQEVPADLPAVWADQMRVRQVILNLLSNAAKFTDRGSITLRAELMQDRPLQAPDGAPLIDFVRVSIIDTGIGIAEKDMPKLFRQFQQVDASSSRRAGGTGLGLNITKQLVEMHGGRIGLSSVYGQGSTFWFTLPTRPYEKPAEPQPPAEEEQDTRRVILAVDDDPGVITLYKRYLEPQGYRVVGVNRSEEVLDMALQFKPYVITLDVLMPHRDGWQVIQELKHHPDTRNIPVVMASIVADQGRGFSLGAADYLVKPILEQDLLSALKRLNGEGTERTVLVIDDEVDNIRLVRRVLEGDSHYRVLEAQGGREGIEAVKSLRPHVIVLDLMMPEVDGFDVLSTLKSDPETRDVPVIVVTAKELTQEDRERLNGHIGALLRKGPLTESELLQDVTRVLERAQAREHK